MPDLDGLTQALPTASAPAPGAPPAAAGRRPRGRARLSRPASLGLNALSVVLGVAIWWALAASGLQLPTPAATASRGLELLRDGSLLDDVLASLRRVVLGFGLGCAAAVPVGFLMGWYPVARALLDPWVQFFRMIPPLALIPLAIVLLGIDETPKVFVIFLAAFLACVVAAYQGVVSVDRTLVNAGRVLGAGDLTLFRRVVIPASMPFILVGMRVGLGSSWATLVAAELIAAQQGLGYRMHNAQLYYDLPTIFVGIIAIGVLGLSMDRILQAVERRVTVWQERR